MSSTFSGLSEILGPSNAKPNASSRKRGSERIILGHVLDIVLDESSPFFNSEYGIGSIRFRAIPEDYSKSEKDISTFANPANRARYQLPLPGEQVVIYPIITGKRLSYVYGAIIKQSLNIAYSSEPFTSTTPFYVDGNILDALVDEASLALRFRDKMQIPYEDYENSSYGITSLREGDMIMEGRFGSSILFTSTMDKVITKELHNEMYIGADEISKPSTTEDGDPVLIIQATKKVWADEPYLIKPSINEADSIVYMTSTQTIPMEVATSKKMNTWNVTVTKPSGLKRALDLDTARLQSFVQGAYDPNTRFAINLNVTGFVGGGGGGFAGGGTAVQAITKDIKDFGTVVATVIAKLEGGYWHPAMYLNGRLKPDGFYGSSGETMMGIDRYAGSSLRDTEAGKQFWNLIDNAVQPAGTPWIRPGSEYQSINLQSLSGAAQTWAWNYKGGPLEAQLMSLAGQMIFPTYERNTNSYMDPQTSALVATDGRLMFHFIYACWNGPGWFKKFANDMDKAVAGGMTNTDELCKVAINSRIGEGLSEGSSPNALIAAGGRKIANIIGVVI